MVKKYKLNEIQMGLITEEIIQQKNSELHNMVGDKKIAHKTPIRNMTNFETDDINNDKEPEVDLRKIQKPRKLLEALEKFENAKSVLSIAAAEASNKQLQEAIYNHWKKINDNILDMMRDFGITH